MGTIAKVTAGGETHAIASSAYAYCSTADSAAAKIATISWDNGTTTIPFSRIKGETIFVKFVHGNSVKTNLTLNVNGTGAASITGSDNYFWKEGAIIPFTFDGTNWVQNTFNIDVKLTDGSNNVPLSTIFNNTYNAGNLLSITGTNGVSVNVTSNGITVSGPGSSTDTKVTQAAAITVSQDYPIILGYSSTTSAITNSVNKSANLVYNPGTKKLKNTGAFECGSLEQGYGINDEALLRSSTIQLWGGLLS